MLNWLAGRLDAIEGKQTDTLELIDNLRLQAPTYASKDEVATLRLAFEKQSAHLEGIRNTLRAILGFLVTALGLFIAAKAGHVI